MTNNELLLIASNLFLLLLTAEMGLSIWTIYSAILFFYTFFVFIFLSGGKVPADNITMSSYMKTIEATVFLVVCSVCSIGILQAICFLAFNLMYRKLK